MSPYRKHPEIPEYVPPKRAAWRCKFFGHRWKYDDWRGRTKLHDHDVEKEVAMARHCACGRSESFEERKEWRLIRPGYRQLVTVTGWFVKESKGI